MAWIAFGGAKTIFGGQAWPTAQNVSHAVGKRAKYQKQRARSRVAFVGADMEAYDTA